LQWQLFSSCDDYGKRSVARTRHAAVTAQAAPLHQVSHQRQAAKKNQVRSNKFSAYFSISRQLAYSKVNLNLYSHLFFAPIYYLY